MVKGYGLLTLVSIFLLCGCSGETVVNDKNNSQINHTINESNLVAISDNKEEQPIPFKIDEIDSKILDLNDPASAKPKPLKGVRYEITLFSKERIPAENFTSYEFEIEANAPLEEFLGPIETLTMSNTLDDGYLYTVAFETVYREHTQEELEALNNERDFNIFVTFQDERYLVEYQ